VKSLAIVGSTIVPMDEPRTLSGHTVVVADGRITAVAPSDAIDTSGMDVLDATGLHLLPALADMHVHFWDPGEAALYLANGIALVRNMWGGPFHLSWRNKVAAREVAGPRVVTASPIVDGPGPDGAPIWPGSTLLTEADDATALVEKWAERGYEQVKGYSLLAPGPLRSLGKASREAGLRLTGHCPNSVTFEQAIDAGQTCFEHLTAIQNGHLRSGRGGSGPRASPEAIRASAEHLDLDAIAELARRMADEQIWNCPTATVWYGMAVPDVEAALGSPLMRYQSVSNRAFWDPRNDFRLRNVDRAAYVDASALWIERRFEVVRILHEASAPLIAGTDTPNPFVMQGFALHDELANLVGAGLSPFDAISCATANAARFLGQTSEWGTIAEGMRADILLVRGDPLSDVGVLRRPEHLLVNGFGFDRAALDEMLERRAQQVAPTDESTVRPHDLGPDPAGVVRKGSLRERVGGSLSSCCSFRHVELPDGGLEIEEIFTGLRNELSKRSVVRLRADMTVQSATVDGDTKTKIERTQTGYRVHTRQEDGRESHREIESDALLPSEELLLSTVPIVASAVAAGGASALDPDGVAVPIEIDEQGNVIVRRPNAPTSLRVTSDADSRIESLEQRLWHGLRVVTRD
jgi:imidazolonepropionase-like amidohydrolase